MNDNIRNTYAEHFGAKFTDAALENIDECGVDVHEDVRLMREGLATSNSLLASCLNGADADRVQGWRDYVEEVTRLASIPTTCTGGQDCLDQCAKEGA